MRRLPAILLATAAGLLLPGAAAGSAISGPVEPGSLVALLPVQDRAGDQWTASDVEQILRFEISKSARVLDPGRVRPLLRRLRIRSIDNLPADRLRTVATELEADWVVSVTLHAAERRGSPWLTLSMRVYEGSSGEMAWAGFDGGSGMDSLGVLGTGVILDMSVLMPRVVRRLTAGLFRDPEAKPARGGPTAQPMGRVAIVPFLGVTRRNGTAAAEAVTEAARATGYRLGLKTVSPGCTWNVLRMQRSIGWGGVSDETRDALRETCGADSILTGAVERYDVGGGASEPEPRVAMAMRLLETESGRILWTGSAEREGWDREGLFELGRVHSQARLTRRMIESLARQLVKERTRQTRVN